MDSVHLVKKTCLSCDGPLRGRIDKKFCNDYCRNRFNNEQKSRNNYSPAVRNINNALLKNRKILAALLLSGTSARASREKLLHLGFHFGYHTHLHTTKSGRHYYYCYDYGYLSLGNDWYLIARKKEE